MEKVHTIRETDLNLALCRLKDEGAHLMSAEEKAKIILSEGLKSGTYSIPSFVSNGGIVIPGKGFYLVKNSPILEDTYNAAISSFVGEEYTLSSRKLESILKNAVKVNRLHIPTKELGTDPTTNLLFGEVAKYFGEWLYNNQVGLFSFERPSETVTERVPYAFQIYLDKNVARSSIGLDSPRTTLGLSNS